MSVHFVFKQPETLIGRHLTIPSVQGKTDPTRETNLRIWSRSLHSSGHGQKQKDKGQRDASGIPSAMGMRHDLGSGVGGTVFYSHVSNKLDV